MKGAASSSSFSLRFLRRKRGSLAAVPVAGGCYSQPEPPLEWEGFFPPIKPSVFSGPDAGHTVIFLLLFSVTQLDRKGSEDSELA